MEKQLTKQEILNELRGSLHIDFVVYLIGHDKETIEQMYNDWRRYRNDVSDSLHIDFAVYLTGHDKETIEQMYNDWRRYR